MKHFICAGCGTKELKDGICMKDKCPLKKRAYAPCNCADDKHFGEFEKYKKKEVKKEPEENPLDDVFKDLYNEMEK
jgi:hypothetical protein